MKTLQAIMDVYLYVHVQCKPTNSVPAMKAIRC